MNENTTKRSKRHGEGGQPVVGAAAVPVMSQIELARLGGGQVAYIKVLSPEEAKRLFPNAEGLPPGITLFALHAADGSPIALTDTRHAAMSHAMDGELLVASVH